MKIGEYQILDEIGRGAFGVVKKLRKGDKEYAVKILDKDKIYKEDLEDGIKNEINLLRMVKHPNVC